MIRVVVGNHGTIIASTIDFGQSMLHAATETELLMSQGFTIHCLHKTWLSRRRTSVGGRRRDHAIPAPGPLPGTVVSGDATHSATATPHACTDEAPAAS